MSRIPIAPRASRMLASVANVDVFYTQSSWQARGEAEDTGVSRYRVVIAECFHVDFSELGRWRVTTRRVSARAGVAWMIAMTKASFPSFNSAIAWPNGYVATLGLIPAASLEHYPRLKLYDRKEYVNVLTTIVSFCLVNGLSVGSLIGFSSSMVFAGVTRSARTLCTSPFPPESTISESIDASLRINSFPCSTTWSESGR